MTPTRHRVAHAPVPRAGLPRAHAVRRIRQ